MSSSFDHVVQGAVLQVLMQNELRSIMVLRSTYDTNHSPPMPMTNDSIYYTIIILSRHIISYYNPHPTAQALRNEKSDSPWHSSKEHGRPFRRFWFHNRRQHRTGATVIVTCQQQWMWLSSCWVCCLPLNSRYLIRRLITIFCVCAHLPLQLRKINEACFPVTYKPSFYEDMAKKQDENLCKFAYFNGFAIGAICTRIEPIQDW